MTDIDAAATHEGDADYGFKYVFNDVTALAKVIDAVPKEIVYCTLEFGDIRISTCTMDPSMVTIAGFDVLDRMIDDCVLTLPEGKSIVPLTLNMNTLKEVTSIAKSDKDLIETETKDMIEPPPTTKRKVDDDDDDDAVGVDDADIESTKRRKLAAVEKKTSKASRTVTRSGGGGKTRLTLLHNLKDNFLKFVFENDSTNKKTAKLFLQDESLSMGLDLPDMQDYDCKIRMYSVSFASLCQKIKTGEVKMKINPRQMIVEFKKSEVEWEHEYNKSQDAIKINWKNKEENSMEVVFSAEKLNKFVPPKGTSRYLELRFYRGDPMMVRYYINDDPRCGSITYLLAPRTVAEGEDISSKAGAASATKKDSTDADVEKNVATSRSLPPLLSAAAAKDQAAMAENDV
jgi:hypothetical protein